MKISNRDELVHNLANLIAENESLLLPYQIDIYAYLDKETGIVTLDEFTNVGGNSWLDDDHYTIYVVNQSCDKPSEFFERASDMADVIGMDIDALRAATAEDIDCDIDDLDDADVKYYIEQHYDDEITQSFRAWYMKEFADQFREKAEEAVAEYESEYINCLEE